MSTYQSPLGSLPLELVLDILCIAAYSSHETALLLTLVNTWAKKGTARCLYETVVLRSRSQVMGFLGAVALAGGWNGDQFKWADQFGGPEPMLLNDRWRVNVMPSITRAL